MNPNIRDVVHQADYDQRFSNFRARTFGPDIVELRRRRAAHHKGYDMVAGIA